VNTQPATPAARYDRALQLARHRCLPPGAPRPQPTRVWPDENVRLLEHYHQWLLGSGASPYVVQHLYVPVAGHVLGLALKPYRELDLATDLDRALEYILAKRLSDEWTSMNRLAVARFRHFLQQQRGQREVSWPAPDLSYYQAGLPLWLIEPLTRYQHLRQSGWRPARLQPAIGQFWSHQVRVWRWLFAHYPIRCLADVKRQHLLDYMDDRLAAHYAPKTINADLRTFHGFLLFLQDQDWRVPQSLLRLPGLKEPESLPRFLTDDQVSRLRADLEGRAATPPLRVQPRDTQLDRAAFYLLWQGGLRLGELEELRLDDLDLPARKLMVRQGKGRRDRAVFLADSAISTLRAYLAARGQGPDDHVFLYRAEPVHKDLVRCRIKVAGERTGVKVTPHALRHTYATQLLNAGCPITSIQKLLGHRRINSTLIYARVHDPQVADDYFAAMAQIEKRLALNDHECEPEPDNARKQLLKLAREFARPRLAKQARLDLVKDLRRVIKTDLPQPAAA
jgi:site-specific recombinase XerD